MWKWGGNSCTNSHDKFRATVTGIVILGGVLGCLISWFSRFLVSVVLGL